MIPPAFGFAIGLAGGSFAGFGAALLLRGRARLSAVLSVVGGLAAIAGSLLGAGGYDRPGMWLVWVSGLAAMPLAVVAYPGLDWRNPLDSSAFLVALASGAVAIATLDHPEDAVVAWLVQVLAVAVRTWWRIDREVPALRQPLLWVASVLALVTLGAGLAAFSDTDLALVVAVGLLGLVPAAMYLGVTRGEVVDVRDVVVRVIVGVVTLFGYVASVMVILALGRTLGVTPAGGWLALICGLVAIGFHPTQTALRGVIDELIYGPRQDPLVAAAAVVDQAGGDPVQALRAIREGLGLPYVALVLEGQSVAASGDAPERTRAIPLSSDGEPDGRLMVGVRPGDLDLTPRDLLVLGLVAPLLAQTVRANRLAADLQAAREHTVTAIEEERRRLRRDLHDGLGPRLTGVAYTLDAARNALAQGAPAEVDGLLAGLRAETTAAITDIRRIVYAMRPPALDELGLVGALRQQASATRRPDGISFGVTIEAPNLPPLPAATEVAAYRIVVEALTNAARHSGGTAATVRFDLRDGEMVATIEDDGGRPSDRWRPGVGLASMRERADEVGGRLTAGVADGRWRVRAVLPTAPRNAPSEAPHDPSGPPAQ